jgi:hypothetical protein
MLRTSVTAGLVWAGLVATVLAASPAPAQTGAPPVSAPGGGQAGAADAAGGFLTGNPGGFMRGSKLVGLDVVGLDNAKVGSIDEVLVDGSGRVRAVVIGVGGFLGLGEKSVAVPFELFLWNTGDVSRAAGPSASVTAGTAPANPNVGTSGGAERMPGANISNQVLDAVPAGRSGNVDPGTGSTGASAASAASGAPATVPVVDAKGGPDRAIVRLTKAELERAPAFRYE